MCKLAPMKPALKTQTDKARMTSETILHAAESVMIEAGYHNFSIRRVASAAGVTVGNLQYHFPTKDVLLKSLLDHCIGRYLKMFASIRNSAGNDPRRQFEALVKGIFEDLNSKKTTMFFPELWSLANHQASATQLMDDMYAQYRAVLKEVIKEINPKLKPSSVDRLALFISASIEGHTVFIGHGKPWQKQTKKLIKIATQSFLFAIESEEL